MTDSNLVAFLNARLAEDEARVVRAADGTVGDRTARELHDFRHDIKSGALGDLMLNPARPDDRTVPWMISTQLEDIADGFWMDWMDRAVREVEAKRRIVDAWRRADVRAEFPGGSLGVSDLLWDALRFLAAVYNDHPDYDPEWA